MPFLFFMWSQMSSLKEIIIFQKKIIKSYYECISPGAINTLKEAKFNMPQRLPFTKNVTQLHLCLENKQKDALGKRKIFLNTDADSDLAKISLSLSLSFGTKVEVSETETVFWPKPAFINCQRNNKEV